MNIFENSKNTKFQGNIGLGSAIQYFTSQNIIVSLPLNDSQDYDLIIDDGNILKRVQVKTCYNKTKYGIWHVNLKICGGSSKTQRIIKNNDQILYDLLFVLCADGCRYLIPKNHIKSKTSININKNFNKFKI